MTSTMNGCYILRFVLASVMLLMMKCKTIICITYLECKRVNQFTADVAEGRMHVSEPSQPFTKTIGLGIDVLHFTSLMTT